MYFSVSRLEFPVRVVAEGPVVLAVLRSSCSCGSPLPFLACLFNVRVWATASSGAVVGREYAPYQLLPRERQSNPPPHVAVSDWPAHAVDRLCTHDDTVIRGPQAVRIRPLPCRMLYFDVVRQSGLAARCRLVSALDCERGREAGVGDAQLMNW